jgi:uncharacterized protein (TIRG00374 family)
MIRRSAPGPTSADESASRSGGTGPGAARRRRRLPRWARVTLRLLLWPTVVSLLVIPQLPRFREATIELQSISVVRLAIGFVLVLASIACYSGLTSSALVHPADRVSIRTMFRIQLSTRALANVVPGGNATASALGFRLLGQAGVSNTGAGFALATAGLGSAVVLNVLFWLALSIAIPTGDIDGVFLVVALAGLVLLVGVAVALVVLARTSGRLAPLAGWVERRLGMEPGRIARAVGQVRERLTSLRGNRPLLRRIVGWSLAQWTFDMAALWVFLSAFDIALDPLILVLVFGAANIAAAVPVTPGGLGIIEGVYLTSLVQIGFTFEAATFGVAAYRLVQYAFPIVAGGISYLTLRTGPWKIGTAAESPPAG